MRIVNFIIIFTLLSINSFGQKTEQKKEEKNYGHENFEEAMEMMEKSLNKLMENDTLMKQMGEEIRKIHLDSIFQSLNLDENYFNQENIKQNFELLSESMDSLMKSVEFQRLNKWLEQMRKEWIEKEPEEKSGGKNKEKKIKKI